MSQEALGYYCNLTGQLPKFALSCLSLWITDPEERRQWLFLVSEHHVSTACNSIGVGDGLLFWVKSSHVQTPVQEEAGVPLSISGFTYYHPEYSSLHLRSSACSKYVLCVFVQRTHGGNYRYVYPPPQVPASARAFVLKTRGETEGEAALGDPGMVWHRSFLQRSTRLVLEASSLHCSGRAVWCHALPISASEQQIFFYSLSKVYGALRVLQEGMNEMQVLISFSCLFSKRVRSLIPASRGRSCLYAIFSLSSHRLSSVLWLGLFTQETKGVHPCRRVTAERTT